MQSAPTVHLETTRGLFAAALGPALVEHHLFMKRIEVEKTAGLEGDALRDYYIWYV